MLMTQLKFTHWTLSTACVSALLFGCAHVSKPSQPVSSTPTPVRPAPAVQSTVPPVAVAPKTQAVQTDELAKPATPAVAPNKLAPSQATSIQAYKKEVAQHIYNRYKDQLHAGKLPPNIPAVGVLELQINAQGYISQTSWRRKPSLNEYALLTEKLVQEAAPFPAPIKLGKVEILDIWLWTKESKFQLDSLTEGQR